MKNKKILNQITIIFLLAFLAFIFPIPIDEATQSILLVNGSYDNSPPITTIELSGVEGSNGWYTSNVTVTLIATDNDSGVKEIHYILNNGEEIVVENNETSFFIATEGTSILEYWAKDNAGNEEPHKIQEIKIDKTPPTVIISSPVNGSSYQSKNAPTLAYTFTDNLNLISTVTVDGWSIEEGIHTVTITVTDAAGNIGSASATYVIDDTPPVTTEKILGEESKDGWFISNVTISLTSTDNLSGVKEIHYVLDGKETIIEGNETSFIMTKEGIHNLTYWAIDKAGNREEPIDKIIKIKSRRIYNVTLLISNWSGDFYFGGVNVSIYDLNGNLVLSGISNSTGCLNVELEEKSYMVTVESDGRIIGSQEIYVNASEVILIKTWTYTLEVTCIDQENNCMPEVTVFLYGQLLFPNSSNETWQLINLAKTNEKGAVIFNNVWNGTYKIIVESGRVIGEKIINLTKSERLTIRCDKTFLELKIVTSTPTENPLSNASILLQDSNGHVFLKGITDSEGYVRFNNVYIDNYTIFVDWLNMEVFSGIVDTNTTKSLKIKVPVFQITLHIVDSFGKPLPYSEISIEKIIGRSYVEMLKMKSDKNGLTSLLLPLGKYKISCCQGIYFGGIIIDLTDNRSETIRCNIHFNVWVLIFLVSLPLSILSLLLERERLKKPLEYRRYRNMLSKLESMYSNGLVEYKIYRKLKEEYETKLMELEGRKRR